jgi:crossover junction endodeoxyribonuclease RuvC
MSTRLYIGIDPGANGGIAVIDEAGRLEYHTKMPLLRDCAKLFRQYAKHNNSSIVYIEKVNSMPNQGVVSVFTFGKAYGQLLGILAAYDFTFLEVPPKTWQKLYIFERSETKKHHKNALKNAAQSLYPHVKMTLYIADAILLAHYAYQSRPRG